MFKFAQPTGFDEIGYPPGALNRADAARWPAELRRAAYLPGGGQGRQHHAGRDAVLADVSLRAAADLFRCSVPRRNLLKLYAVAEDDRQFRCRRDGNVQLPIDEFAVKEPQNGGYQGIDVDGVDRCIAFTEQASRLSSKIISSMISASSPRCQRLFASIARAAWALDSIAVMGCVSS
jgi:hypothetical protein